MGRLSLHLEKLTADTDDPTDILIFVLQRLFVPQKNKTYV